MTHFEQRVTIERPIEEVWRFIVDVFNAPRYQSDFILGFRQSSPGPPRVGSTWRARFTVLGLEREMALEVTEWEPPRRAAVRMTASFGSGFRRVTLTPTEGATEYFLSMDVTLRGLWRIVWPIVKPFLLRKFRSHTERLKEFVESEPR